MAKNRKKKALRSKRIPINGGMECTKCGLWMQRYTHGPNWQPKATQKYWFEYWDVCPHPSNHLIQHYPEACRYRENLPVSHW